MQTLPLGRVLVVDTCSIDGTADAARAAGYDVVSVSKAQFNHGGTRQMAARALADTDVLIYLTQDAILATPDSLAKLVSPFSDPLVAAVYGRQLPRRGAGVLESHARRFNYPPQSIVRDLDYRKRAGFKAIFSSNSFAAYRTHSLREVGGFPNDVLVSEETMVFARMLLAGYKTAYAGDAMVYHSHEYSVFATLQRYFDIGAMHAREPWIIEEFGHLRDEGKRFFYSELQTIWPRHLHLLPLLISHTLAKAVGYKLGQRGERLDVRIARYLSQQKNYWA